MKRHPSGSASDCTGITTIREVANGVAALKRLAVLSALLIAGFVAVALGEGVVAQAGLRADEARSSIGRMEVLLQRQTDVASVEASIRRETTRLHLQGSTAELCATLIGELERVAAKNGVRLVGIRRGFVTPPSTRNALTDSYTVVMTGTYPHTLLSLIQLSHAHLVFDFKSISFERIERSTAPLVRASVELDILRLGGSNATHVRS